MPVSVVALIVVVDNCQLLLCDGGLTFVKSFSPLHNKEGAFFSENFPMFHPRFFLAGVRARYLHSQWRFFVGGKKQQDCNAIGVIVQSKCPGTRRIGFDVNVGCRVGGCNGVSVSDK